MTEILPADDLARAVAMAKLQNRVQTAGGEGRSYTVLIDGEQTDGRYCLLELVVAPGGGPGMHRHDFEELFMLLDGEIEFTVRGEPHVVSAPRCINITANAPHRFRNRSSTPAHLLCMCTPAGLEDFFEMLGKLMASDEAQSPSNGQTAADSKRALTRELALKYRMEPLNG